MSISASKLGFNPEYSDSEPTHDQIRSLKGYALLEFGAPWCGHCKAARSAIQEVLTAQQPELTHIKVYDGKGRPLGRAFSITLWPTLILLRDGGEVARLVRPLTVTEVNQLIST